MTHLDFYTLVTTLPLLQGTSAEDILDMQEKGILRLVSIEPEEGDIIVQGQYCKTLTMLLQGSMMCTSNGDGWILTEEIKAPAIIEEEAVWSLPQQYNHTYRPLSYGKLVVIDRRHVMQTMMRNEVFRINLLTRLATRLEKHHTTLQTHSKQDIQGKIKQFFRDISYTNNLPKHLKIKMTTLAQLLDETRLNISKTLHQMQANGEVAITREQITLLKQ
jgi:CRP-like cAMP-binding protein